MIYFNAKDLELILNTIGRDNVTTIAPEDNCTWGAADRSSPGGLGYLRSVHRSCESPGHDHQAQFPSTGLRIPWDSWKAQQEAQPGLALRRIPSFLELTELTGHPRPQQL